MSRCLAIVEERLREQVGNKDARSMVGVWRVPKIKKPAFTAGLNNFNSRVCFPGGLLDVWFSSDLVSCSRYWIK